MQVIQHDKPCHLYLDLEYSRACNPNTDGEAMIDALLKMLAAAVK